MRKAELTTAISTAGLAATMAIAVTMLVLGLGLALGAARVHAAQPDISTAAWRGSGLFIIAVGAVALFFTRRGWREITTIEIHDDGTWLLRRRLGLPAGRVLPATRRSLSMVGWTVVTARAKAVSSTAVVDGRLLLDDGRRYRLATSGQKTYEQALATLGYADTTAPRPGERREIPPHACGPNGPA